MGLDQTLVDNAASGAVARKLVVAGQEVLVAQIQRRCHQRADIDARRWTKHDARGIEQKHLSVGRQAAEDLTGAAIADAVQRHAVAAGLHKLHRGVFADIERAPVGHEFVATLTHCHRVTALRHAGQTADNLSSRWQLIGTGCSMRQLECGTGDQTGHQHCAADIALAPAARAFCHGHRRAGLLIPDNSIHPVH